MVLYFIFIMLFGDFLCVLGTNLYFFLFYLFEKLFFFFYYFFELMHLCKTPVIMTEFELEQFCILLPPKFSFLQFFISLSWQSYMVILASFDVFIICFLDPPITFLGFPQVCCHLISYSCFYLQNSLQIFPTFTISSPQF